MAIRLLVAAGMVWSASSARPLAAQPADKAGRPPAPAAEELVVSVNRASIEVVDAAGTDFALETFEVVEGRAVPVDAPVDHPLWRSKGILWLNLDPPERSGLVYRLHVPKETALDLHASQGNITVAQHEGGVRVTTSMGSARLGFIAGPVDIQTSVGDAWLERGGPGVDVKTSGGKMLLGEIYGPAILTSSGGGIAVQQANGKVTARTSGGSISIYRARQSVRAEAGGGGLAVNFTGSPNGESILRASGGPVRAGLPAQANYRIAARGDGEMETDLPVEWRDTHEGYRRGLLNAQGGTLTALAVGGGIQLRSSDAVAAQVDQPFKMPAALVELPKVDESGVRALRVQERTSLAGSPFPSRRADKAGGALQIDRDEAVWQDADWKQVTMLVPGLLLRSGRWVEGEVTRLDEMQVSYRASSGETRSTPAGEVAVILFAPVPDTRQALLDHNAQGVLLRNGDFFEGALKKLETGQVTLSSALFGLKKFSLGKDAVALVLRGR